jgi:hypothetical protein
VTLVVVASNKNERGGAVGIERWWVVGLWVILAESLIEWLK